MAEYYPKLGHDSSFSHPSHELATVIIYVFLPYGHLEPLANSTAYKKIIPKTGFCYLFLYYPRKMSSMITQRKIRCVVTE
jgi:hypothetical protein